MDVLSPIGNQGWCEKGKATSARFDQQGIDAMAMVLFYQQAYRITGDAIFLQRMYKSYQWFLGKNDLELLYTTPPPVVVQMGYTKRKQLKPGRGKHVSVLDFSHDCGIGITSMKVAMLAPLTWRTPPRNYGPWEQVASVLTEALVSRRNRCDLVCNRRFAHKGNSWLPFGTNHWENTRLMRKWLSACTYLT